MSSILFIMISLIINVVIAILGIVPSFFLTVINVQVLGVFNGFLISLLGESLGAIISFYIYRKGFKQVPNSLLNKYPKIKLYTTAPDKQMWLLIIGLRIFPYMPSGLVTYVGAMSRISIINFTIFSTIGKIPAMIIEVFGSILAIYGLNTWGINIIFVAIGLFLIYKTTTKLKKK